MRVRARFTKLGKVRWTSHRDVARMWERAFRRVGVPLTYTGGFSPRPKVSFGLALPTGHESLAEYLDFEVEERAALDMVGLADRLSPALPIGVDAVAAAVVDERAPSLQEEVTSCTWRIELPVAGGEAAQMVGRVLEAPSIVVTRERKGKRVTDDIRPAILGLSVLGTTEEGGAELEAEVATRTRGLRPAELVTALQPGLELSRACRINQWIERDGARWEPLTLPLDATGAPHAEPVGTGGRAR